MPYTHAAPLRTALALALSLCVACSASQVFAANSTVAVWENGYEYVHIVPNDGRPGGHHPADVLERDLRLALRHIQIKSISRFFSSKKPLPLFSEEAAKSLARRIAKGLRHAKRNQDILFRIGDTQEIIGGALNRRLYTAGRVFWYKNRLHIIFGGIRNNVGKQSLYGQDETAWLTNEPEDGARRIETALDYEVIPTPGIAYATKKRRDWIAVRPGRTRSQVAPAKDSYDLESRITKLKRLYDKGLISEREYRARKRELLDTL